MLKKSLWVPILVLVVLSAAAFHLSGMVQAADARSGPLALDVRPVIEKVRLSGILSEMTADTFVVGGKVVRIDAITRFELSVRDGAPVEVEALALADGTFLALLVKSPPAAAARIDGPVSSLAVECDEQSSASAVLPGVVSGLPKDRTPEARPAQPKQAFSSSGASDDSRSEEECTDPVPQDPPGGTNCPEEDPPDSGEDCPEEGSGSGSAAP